MIKIKLIRLATYEEATLKAADACAKSRRRLGAVSPERNPHFTALQIIKLQPPKALNYARMQVKTMTLERRSGLL